ncbi:ABC transporter ATP-binding protein, partial [Aerococcus urinae]
LVDLQDKNYFQLSGGEQQRVMIAMALAKQVDILLMDEPSNHLDINYQLSILKTIKQEGLTVFTSLHDLNLAARFCDRLILLNQGSIVLNGPTEEVLTSPQLSQVFKVDIVTNRLPNGYLGINYL